MNLMQYDMSHYGSPPQFPRPTTPVNPSSHGDLSQVNISYFDSSKVNNTNCKTIYLVTEF
jgi:hypothetical protein